MNRAEPNFQQYKPEHRRVVCWHCKKGGHRGDSPLKKLDKWDYVCDNCIVYGKPKIGNVSYEK